MEYQAISEFVNNYRTELIIAGAIFFLGWDTAWINLTRNQMKIIKSA